MDDPNMHAYEDQYMDTTDLILRSVCETDPADPDLKDTVCIGISDLKAILDLHLLASSKPEAKPAQQDAVDARMLAALRTLVGLEVFTDQDVCLSTEEVDALAEADAAIDAAISAKKGGAV